MTRHPRALLPVVAAIVVAASPTLAAPTRAPAAPPSYTLEHALTLRGISDLTWSADGRRLAFVVNAPDTSENTTNQDIWLLDVAAGSARRLTRHPKNDFSPTFSPGGDTIAFVATRAAGDDAKPAIYMMSLAGGDPWAFGSYDEAVGEVRWSPDGRWLAYVETDTLAKSIREWRKKKWDQVVEDERLQYPALWVVEVATGRQRRLTSGPHAVWNVRWAPDSRSIAFLVSPTGKPDDGNLVDIGIVPVGRIGDPLPPLRTLGVIGSAFAWSPDGRWIAWAAGTHRDVYVEKSELWVAPAAGGRAVDLTAGLDEDAETPAWSPGSDTLYFHAARGVSTVLAAVARAGGSVTLGVDRRADAGAPVIARDGRMAWVQGDPLAPAEVRVAERAGAAAAPAPPAGPPRPAPPPAPAAPGGTTGPAAVARAGGGVTLGVDRRADAGTPVIARDGRMAWVQGDPLAPAEVRVAERAGAAGRAMSAVNAEVAKLALGSTRTVRWTSTDHERIEGLLVRPHGARDGAPLKTLVLLHGGPYTDRYALGFQSMAQYFAAHGYQVFMPNFRSSGGYGTAFMVRKRSDWGGQDWSDVMTGIDSLIAAKLADPNRLGVLGHSYGGYLSAWAITHTDRFKAACVSAGAVDLAAHYGQSDIHKYRAYEFEGPPWETPEHWRRSSPMSAITRVKTPTLILVGESDQRVPMPQSQELYTALTTLHVPCEFVHYPREPHGIREPRHRADWFERMRGWFDRWIR